MQPVAQLTARPLAQPVAQLEPVVDKSSPEELELSLVKRKKTITRRRVVRKKITSISTGPVAISEPNIAGNDSLSQTDLSQPTIRSKSSSSTQKLLANKKAHSTTDIELDVEDSPENETTIEQV